MRTPEKKLPNEGQAGRKPDYTRMSKEMFLAALRDADQAGTVFIHQSGETAATHVLLTAERYRNLLHYTPRPMHAKFWDHSHVEPEEFEDET